VYQPFSFLLSIFAECLEIDFLWQRGILWIDLWNALINLFVYRRWIFFFFFFGLCPLFWHFVIMNWTFFCWLNEFWILKFFLFCVHGCTGIYCTLSLCILWNDNFRPPRTFLLLCDFFFLRICGIFSPCWNYLGPCFLNFWNVTIGWLIFEIGLFFFSFFFFLFLPRELIYRDVIAVLKSLPVNPLEISWTLIDIFVYFFFFFFTTCLWLTFFVWYEWMKRFSLTLRVFTYRILCKVEVPSLESPFRVVAQTVFLFVDKRVQCECWNLWGWKMFPLFFPPWSEQFFFVLNFFRENCVSHVTFGVCLWILYAWARSRIFWASKPAVFVVARSCMSLRSFFYQALFVSLFYSCTGVSLSIEVFLVMRFRVRYERRALRWWGLIAF